MKECEGIRGDGVVSGEDNVELDIEVAGINTVGGGNGHTLVNDHLVITGANNAGMVDLQDVVVKVSDICSETTKGLDKADIEVVEEVVTTTNEGRVLLLLELDDDVTGDGVGGLISSALENVGRSGDTALGNVNLDSLLLLDSLVTVTLAALRSFVLLVTPSALAARAKVAPPSPSVVAVRARVSRSWFARSVLV